MAYATDAARWRALSIRDADANGHFIYSVKSTRIYCRPTCPGRLARRANVGFYATPLEAEAAGFRACKRCKPNTVLEDPQERAVEKACVLIDEALENEDASALRLQDLAKRVNLTPRYFHKIFKDKTGLTPKEYAKRKATERNSPSTASTSATTADGSNQSWDWNTFDFNNLIDLGTDSSSPNVDFTGLEGHSSTIDPDLDFDMTSFIQSWSDSYAFDQSLPRPADCDNLADPFLGLPTTMGHYEKATPSVSTFELDAAALLDSDSAASTLQT
jgi:methylphosphotriester-DNA--protein-cysteine methyltransferase